MTSVQPSGIRIKISGCRDPVAVACLHEKPITIQFSIKELFLKYESATFADEALLPPIETLDGKKSRSAGKKKSSSYCQSSGKKSRETRGSRYGSINKA